MYNYKNCVKCGNILNEDAVYCTRCGTHVPVYKENFCVNPKCPRCIDKHTFGPKDKYCDQCGKPTTLGKEITDLL